VTLPYSKDESFSVPWNLYILGTMNTADKSIALVDVALRRRFGFIELMPDYSKIDPVTISGKLINLPKILENINRKITILYDRDHQIGHSYLMNIKANEPETIDKLKHAFYNEIIPLIQEYFYNDWEKLRDVLGQTLIKEVMKAEEAQNLYQSASQGIYEINNLDDTQFIDALISLEVKSPSEETNSI
jgi:5-methylcytosine-specific restriction endonuclease McrBC GTP-binding regulatory subunit McrB